MGARRAPTDSILRNTAARGGRMMMMKVAGAIAKVERSVGKEPGGRAGRSAESAERGRRQKRPHRERERGQPQRRKEERRGREGRGLSYGGSRR